MGANSSRVGDQFASRNWVDMIKSLIENNFYNIADHAPYYDVPTTLHVKDIEVKRYQPRPTDIIVDGVFNESSK